MDETAERRSETLGGWGALAQGALTVAAFAAQIAMLTLGGGKPTAAPPIGVVLLLAAITVASGLALLASVRGVRFALRPPSGVVWAASVAGWLGAAVLVLSGLIGFYGVLARAPVTPTAVRISEGAPLLVGVWAIAAMAAAWKVRRLPAWVRVVGVVFGAAALASPALGVTRPVQLLAGLAFWFGLGAALLRDARFPHAASASDSGAQP